MGNPNAGRQALHCKPVGASVYVAYPKHLQEAPVHASLYYDAFLLAILKQSLHRDAPHPKQKQPHGCHSTHSLLLPWVHSIL